MADEFKPFDRVRVTLGERIITGTLLALYPNGPALLEFDEAIAIPCAGGGLFTATGAALGRRDGQWFDRLTGEPITMELIQ